MTIKKFETLQEELYKAFLLKAETMNQHEIKQLSWFGHNKPLLDINVILKAIENERSK